MQNVTTDEILSVYRCISHPELITILTSDPDEEIVDSTSISRGMQRRVCIFDLIAL